MMAALVMGVAAMGVATEAAVTVGRAMEAEVKVMVAGAVGARAVNRLV